MLDSVADVDLSAQLWNTVTSRAQLPCDPDEYFGVRGVAGALCETRRQYFRMHMRETAILFRGAEQHGIYTKDVSPKGIGFLSPVQIFPCECIKILLHDNSKLELELRRCRRVDENCYECGTVYIDGVIPPPVYKRLIQSQRRRH